MNVQHLYNSSGAWIAFRIGDNVYKTDGRWIGWLPWGDGDVVDVEGRYLGTIYRGERLSGERLFKEESHAYRDYPGYPGYPGFAGYPGYPGFAGYVPLPSGMMDVNL